MYSVYHIFSIFLSCSIFQKKTLFWKIIVTFDNDMQDQQKVINYPKNSKFVQHWITRSVFCFCLTIFMWLFFISFGKRGWFCLVIYLSYYFFDFFLILSISNDIHILSFLNNCNLRLLNAILNLEHIIF